MLKVEAVNIGSLYLNPIPFAKGGEGLLYEIKAPKSFQQQVVKLYYKEKRTFARAEKIDYLIQYPPTFLREEELELAWPTARVEENGQFAGFMMPKVAGAPLEILCTAKLPKKWSKEWERFDFKNANALALRQRVCYNLAVALQEIHLSRQYAIVDLKPENVLLQPNGIVSIVDLDSIEVFEEGHLKFPASVATPEFSPPEFYATSNNYELGRECWDRFSMAVIFYKLLTGIHPFAASAKGPYAQMDSLAAKIEHGLFVHQPSLQAYFERIPPLHQRFFQLSVELQDAFMQTFAFGLEQADLRTTAREWCWALAENIEELQEKRAELKPFLINFPDLELSDLPKALKKNRESLFIEQLRQLQASKGLKGSWWRLPQKTTENTSPISAEFLKSLKELGLKKARRNFWRARYQEWEAEQTQQLQQLAAFKLQLKEAFVQKKKQAEKALRELNQALAYSAQTERLDKRTAYQQLQNHPIWKAYRGNQLEAKKWHLQNKTEAQIAQSRTDLIKASKQLETEQHEALAELESAYYQRLAILEKQAKENRNGLDEAFTQLYLSEVKKDKENAKKEIGLLQSEFFEQLAVFEEQHQKNIANLTEQLRLKGKPALKSFLEQKKLQEQMHQEQLEALRKSFELKLNAAEQQEQALPQRNQEELLKEKRKLWKQKALNRIQQELQAAKTKAETSFIQQRQLLAEELKNAKEKLRNRQENTEKKILEQQRLKGQQLENAWILYQQQLAEAERLFAETKASLEGELLLLRKEFLNQQKVYQQLLRKAYADAIQVLEESWKKIFI